MASLKKIEGILPSVCIIYTDETCKTINEDEYTKHLRFLLKHDIGALVCGGHAGETECLTLPERKRLIEIAREGADGNRKGGNIDRAAEDVTIYRESSQQG